MKKAYLALVVGAALVLSACGADKKEGEESAEKALLNTYESEAEQHSYALGASMGAFAKGRHDQQDKLSIEYDIDALKAGFEDALAGKEQFSMEEIQGFAQASDMKLREAQAAVAELEAEAAKAEGAAFLAANASVEGVVTTESGLQHQVITEGTGVSPTAADTVKVHYRGTLINGEQFDSSYDRGEPISFPLSGVISGWTEGLQLMKEGGKSKLFIPSELAYGGRSTGSIPANSALVFEVELLEVIKADTE